jgi:hypothetical protein
MRNDECGIRERRSESPQSPASLLVGTLRAHDGSPKGRRQPELEGGDEAVCDVGSESNGRNLRRRRNRAVSRVDRHLDGDDLPEAMGQLRDDPTGELRHLRAQAGRSGGNVVGANRRRHRQSQKNLSRLSRHASGNGYEGPDCLSAHRPVKPHAVIITALDNTYRLPNGFTLNPLCSVPLSGAALRSPAAPRWARFQYSPFDADPPNQINLFRKATYETILNALLVGIGTWRSVSPSVPSSVSNHRPDGYHRYYDFIFFHRTCRPEFPPVAVAV